LNHQAKTRPAAGGQLLYVLQPGAAEGSITVEMVGAPKPLDVEDRRITRRLSATGNAADGSEDFVDTLRAILATGRGRWATPEGTVLRQGPAVQGQLAWRTEAGGARRAELDLPGQLEPLLLATPWYADPRTGAVGEVHIDLPPRVLRTLLSGRAMAGDFALQVAEELARRAPSNRPTPPARPAANTIEGPPVPLLVLTAVNLPSDPMGHLWTRGPRRGGSGPIRLPLAQLSFRYGPVAVPAFGASTGTTVVDGKTYRIVRDRGEEGDAVERLRDFDLARLSSLAPGRTPTDLQDALVLADPDAWVDFVATAVPALREAGWSVEIEPAFPLRVATLSGDITAQVHELPGIDWFDLELGAMVDGQRVDLLPALLRMLGDGGLDIGERTHAMVKLPDGRLLNLPLTTLRPFIATILELFAGGAVNPETGRARLPRASLADLALAEADGTNAGIVWQGGEALRALGRQLRETDGIPRATLPASFNATLRPYQASGVDWLQFLMAAGLGGVLADDMGLGKTVQALAHLAIEQAAGRLDKPALVICPTSLVANWRAEADRFTPTLRILTLHGPDRRALFDAIPNHDLVITTYPLLNRDHAELVLQDWHVVILDEAQIIKNPQAGTTKLAGTLRGRQRLCLSGTPLENHLGELWSLFDFLMPGFLGDSRSFTRTWRTPIEKGGDMDRRTTLARRVAPFLLRRTKAQVAADLPEKTEMIEHIELEAPQRAIYEGIRLTMHAKVKEAVAERGLSRSGIIILDALLKLRQACCDPRLLKLTTTKTTGAGSAKLERLMEMLPELLEEGRRILLFSQFTSMLALIEEALAEARIPYVILTGETRDRASAINQFQNGDVPLFLISLKAGGVGLNLTAADTVIHYDPWWNPAVEDQATDRAHRIGQDKPVFVHRLITRGTIEEKMESLKARKQALADSILDAGEHTALAITEEDIEALFAEADGEGK
jgi:superfamily II DNA or RNA helicase